MLKSNGGLDSLIFDTLWLMTGFSSSFMKLKQNQYDLMPE